MTTPDTAGPDLANRRRFTVAAFRATRRYPGPAGALQPYLDRPGLLTPEQEAGDPDVVAASPHVYGADLRERGTSVRRCYRMAVR